MVFEGKDACNLKQTTLSEGTGMDHYRYHCVSGPMVKISPVPRGVLQTYTPQTIVRGRTIDYQNHCNMEFGAYIECHEDNDPSNMME